MPGVKGNKGGRGYPKPRIAKHCECGDHAWTEITRGFVVLVSPEDAGLLEIRAFVAKVVKRGVYAYYNDNSLPTRPSVYLHRLVMLGALLDHKNGNGLDCRRDNLRLATASTNNANRRKRSDAVTSKYKGVTRHRRHWQTSVFKDGEVFKYGVFRTEVEAAEAYRRWSIEAFGEFASSRT